MSCPVWLAFLSPATGIIDTNAGIPAQFCLEWKECLVPWNADNSLTFSKIRWAVFNMPHHAFVSILELWMRLCFHAYTPPKPHSAPSFPSALRKETTACGCRFPRKFWWIISAALICLPATQGPPSQREYIPSLRNCCYIVESSNCRVTGP